jgi:flagellar protein FlaJ
MKKLPFAPFPPKTMKRLSKFFYVLGNPIVRGMPGLKEELGQARIELDVREYIAQTIVAAVFYFYIFVFLFVILRVVLEIDLFPINLLITLVGTLFMLFSGLAYPKILISRRMRELEKNLVPALRHILIEVKSGVPLFNAMVGITNGYGEVSAEFKKIVDDINTGAKELDALNNTVKRNPSFSFRRAIWQISNALMSGADVGDALHAIIEDLTKEQVTAIRKYGQELNPWTMIYMVAAVIIPSLGITFLVVISAFTGVLIPKIIYPMIIAELIGFQLFFMNFVKSKRPPI